MGFALVTFETADGPRVGVLAAEHIADAEPALAHLLGPRPPMAAVLDRWDDVLPYLRDFAEWVEWHSVTGRVPLAAARLLAPLPRPTNLFLALPDSDETTTALAALPTSAIVGPHAAIALPHGVAEVEATAMLAAVIGRPGRDLALYDALGVVAGYTLLLDVRLPATAVGPTDALARHGRRAFKPLGPALLPAEFAPDLRQLSLTTTVNGQPYPATSSGDSNVAVAERLARLSRLCGLTPGDLLGAGVPAGPTVTLAAGDTISVVAPDLGQLTLVVRQA